LPTCVVRDGGAGTAAFADPRDDDEVEEEEDRYDRGSSMEESLEKALLL